MINFCIQLRYFVCFFSNTNFCSFCRFFENFALSGNGCLVILLRSVKHTDVFFLFANKSKYIGSFPKAVQYCSRYTRRNIYDRQAKCQSFDILLNQRFPHERCFMCCVHIGGKHQICRRYSRYTECLRAVFDYCNLILYIVH